MYKNKSSQIGNLVTFGFFIIIFLILFVWFFNIQSTGEIMGENLLKKSDNLHTQTTNITAERGVIYDSHGEVLAQDAVSYTLQAVLSKEAKEDANGVPRYVDNPKETAKQLAQFISMDESQILKKLQQENVYQVEFGSAGKISSTAKSQIEALNLNGILFKDESKRFYPNGLFASHIIGFVSAGEGEEVKGVLGLEKQYNDILEGANGVKSFKVDKRGRILPTSDVVATPAQNGQDIHTTLDKKIQIFLEEALKSAEAEYQPEKMIGIVADAKTGAILAMSQRPSFDLNTRKNATNAWSNLAIEESFEPGSTFKTITLAAAVNEGIFPANELFRSGQMTIIDRTIRDYNQSWGTISYLEGWQRSSNVGFAKLGTEKLKAEQFRDYIWRFGFEDKTGIELPNEVSSSIVFKYPIERATTAFGQGTAVTPIQQIQAMTAITNGGQMMKPYIVDKIVDSNKKEVTYQHEPTVVGKPITPETAKTILSYLDMVVSAEAGSGRIYAIDGYSIGGKTGTAQIPAPGGGYLGAKSSDYIFSFMGMAPIDDPEVIMYIAVQQPNLKPDENGHRSVAHVFRPVMEKTLTYLNIKPDVKPEDKDTDEKIKAEVVPDFVNLDITETQLKAFQKENPDIQTVIIGPPNGKVIAQSKAVGEKIFNGERLVIVTEGEWKLPNLKGWSQRDVIQLSSILQLETNYEGQGFVTKQKPAKGTVVKAGDTLSVTMKLPR